MLSKRKLLTIGGSTCGITRLLEYMPQRPALFVLNYHRVGNPKIQGGYDTAVFSATAEDFEAQITELKRKFTIIQLAEAFEYIENPSKLHNFCVLLTFDDGYRDNYDLAFPILRSAGVPATFFLTTSYVNGDALPWWEIIAYIIRNTKRDAIRLNGGRNAEVVIAGRPLLQVIREAILIYKQSEGGDLGAYVAELAQACKVCTADIPTNDLFMNWEQARELLAGGMTIGSHTHTHAILSKMAPAAQAEEVQRSRAMLLQHTGCDVSVISYPVGSSASFTADTVNAVKAAGYRAAFSFYGGLNTPPDIDSFDVKRTGVDLNQSLALFKIRTCLAASTSMVRMRNGWQAWLP
jgi:peptidoglycan/xylan/chitin deacetylase (PgdA/CDA1 family)